MLTAKENAQKVDLYASEKKKNKSKNKNYSFSLHLEACKQPNRWEEDLVVANQVPDMAAR